MQRTSDRCPTCKQPMPVGPRRVCFDCKQPMSNHHKWTWVERNGIMTCAHRHCDNPTSYKPKGD